MKCRSTFVRRDLLLRHDRTVHAKDGGIPLHSEVKRRAATKASPVATPSKPSIQIDTAALEQIEATSDGMVDLETAAMLMTDLHHKATAQMSNQMALDAVAGSETNSPSVPAMLEPTVTYPSGAIALPQLPWDQIMPPALAEPKSHSISSSISGSQDSQASWTSVSTLQPPTNAHLGLPPIMERTASGSELINPHVQNIANSLSTSAGSSTPGAYSPYPYLAGPESPVDFRRSPGPTSNAVTPPKAPQVENDDERNQILDNIKDCDSERAILDTFRLPNRIALNRYLATYFNLFHHHQPFLHPSTFKPSTTSAPLLLAVLSIGALYTFEEEQAYMLHIGSKVLVNNFLQNKENFSSRKCPLWTMRSTLLNMIFASWSGDPKGLEWACSIKSLLANMVAGNKYELKLRTDAREGRHPTREEWIEDEGCKRTYFAVYIFFGLLTLTYNHTPAISFNEFDSLDLPCSESLWNLEGAENDAWREKLASSSIMNFRDAHDNLFQGEPARYSAFASRVMINALFLEVWSMQRSPQALQDVLTEYKLRLALETWEKSLDLCESETIMIPLSAPHKGHPLIFNAMAMYRNTRARLEVDLRLIQEALRYHDPYEVAAAMTQARENIKRSQEMTKVIQECFDCVEIAALQGIRWVARTSATNWSVEHPLCGFDLLVILSLWLYRLEHDEEPATEDELQMYNKVRNLFDDDSVDIYGSKLSSTVARAWGGMIDEVVVWGLVYHIQRDAIYILTASIESPS
jgi:Fungal specific transcription factor domain